MLTNSLSLDEEDAVQAELKELQQETVSSLPIFLFEESLGSLITTWRLVTRSARRRNTDLAPRRSQHGTCINRTGYFTSHLATHITDSIIRIRNPTAPRRDANRASCDPCLTASG